MPASSNSARVECRFLSGAVALERALLPDGVRALENPVLPGGEAREDFRFHRFGAAEAQIGFEPGERIGRKARPLLQKHADLILPVDVMSAKVTRPRLSAVSASSLSPMARLAFSSAPASARKRLARRESPFDMG